MANIIVNPGAIDKLQSDVGDVSNLTTSAKNSLVAAVNEHEGDITSLNSKLTPTLILEQIPTTSGEASYNCDWSSYNALIIAIGNYGNIYNTYFVPTSEFNATASGHAIFASYGGGQEWAIYKNGNNKVTIFAPANIQSSTRIRIWGMN